MNYLENRINNIQYAEFITSINKCKAILSTLLQKYSEHFSSYTDHSLIHTQIVCNLVSRLVLTKEEIDKLNIQEVYILCMACYIHDIGMCVPYKEIELLKNSNEFIDFEKRKKGGFQDYLRNIHHKRSYEFIRKNYKELGIVDEYFAEAIAIVSLGHRKENLGDRKLFNPKFVIIGGFVNLSYLACILRISDELDITALRTPYILFEHFRPNNKISINEWTKHLSLYSIERDGNILYIAGKTTVRSIYYAINSQIDKLERTTRYCKKIIDETPSDYTLSLNTDTNRDQIRAEGFNPIKITFQLDKQSVFNSFLGDSLYPDKFDAIREVLTNAIDAINLRKVFDDKFTPLIKISLLDDNLVISDNGTGMTLDIVKNYFSSFFQSYYSKNGINSIGQFGIGVFSYFMLSHSFTIETRWMNENEGMCFTVFDSIDEYFDFQTPKQSIDIGTLVSIKLKPDILNELNIESIIKIVGSYIKDVDIPIQIGSKEGSGKEYLFKENYELTQEELFNDLKYDFGAPPKNLTFLIEKLRDDEVDLIASFPIFIIDGYFKIIDKEEYRHQYSYPFNISVKGIALKEERIEKSLDHLTGKINLKNEKGVNLNKGSLVNSEVVNSKVQLIESKILEQLISNWQSLNPNKQCENFDDFLNNELKYSNSSSSNIFIRNHKQLFLDNFVFKIILNKQRVFKTAKDILKEYQELLLEETLDSAINANMDTNLPCIVSKSTGYSAFYDILHELGYKNYFYAGKSAFYNVFAKNDLIPDSKSFWRFDAYLFTDNSLFSPMGSELWGESVFNLNHSITKYCLENFDRIENNKKLSDPFFKFFKRAYRFSYYKWKKEFKEMNQILKDINFMEGTKFKITKNDLPKFVQNLIK